MKIIKWVLLSMYVFIPLMLFAPMLVDAQTIIPGANDRACVIESPQFFGLPTWYKFLNATPDPTTGQCTPVFDPTQDIPKVLLAVFEIVMRLLGVIAVAMVVWGGFQYITSQGEPEATKNARNTIVNALIGLGIAISATAIVNLIGNNLLK